VCQACVFDGCGFVGVALTLIAVSGPGWDTLGEASPETQREVVVTVKSTGKTSPGVQLHGSSIELLL
jgi:hypothetical protein